MTKTKKQLLQENRELQRSVGLLKISLEREFRESMDNYNERNIYMDKFESARLSNILLVVILFVMALIIIF